MNTIPKYKIGDKVNWGSEGPQSPKFKTGDAVIVNSIHYKGAATIVAIVVPGDYPYHVKTITNALFWLREDEISISTQVIPRFKVGDRVKHCTNGMGTVIEPDKKGMIVIRFDMEPFDGCYNVENMTLILDDGYNYNPRNKQQTTNIMKTLKQPITLEITDIKVAYVLWHIFNHPSRVLNGRYFESRPFMNAEECGQILNESKSWEILQPWGESSFNMKLDSKEAYNMIMKDAESIKIGTNTVEFKDGKIKVGCTEIDNAIVLKIAEQIKNGNV